MTPDQFISTLSVHFTARHETDEQMAQWFDHMSRALAGYSGKVLEKTASDIIHERKTRSFPLIGEIREVADRHAPRTHADYAPVYYGRSHRLPDTPEQIERYRLAAEWRAQVAKPYGGDFDAYLTATAHRRQGGARATSKRSTFKGLSGVSIRMTGEQPE